MQSAALSFGLLVWVLLIINLFVYPQHIQADNVFQVRQKHPSLARCDVLSFVFQAMFLTFLTGICALYSTAGLDGPTDAYRAAALAFFWVPIGEPLQPP